MITHATRHIIREKVSAKPLGGKLNGMNLVRFAAVCALVVPVACGGVSNAPTMPMPTTSSGPSSSGSESITPAGTTTTAPLPSIGGIYGGEIVLPPGSGAATLTFSLNTPPGVATLTELTPSPQVAYISITAQSGFTLAASPGLNLTVPTAYMGIDMWLNYYGSTAWSSNPQQLGWPSTVSGVSAMCFRAQGGAISLQQGQSLYLGINGDNVLPTPISTGTPPPCPQAG